MDMLKQALAANAKPDLKALAAALPYARWLGVEAEMRGSELTTILRYSPELIGNPVLPALHGGVMGAFLEITAILQVAFDAPSGELPKPVDINIDYLRSARPVDAYGRAWITKLGRRVVNVHAEAWQDHHEKPVTTLRGHFLLTAPENGKVTASS